jgi:hypothetical protein
MRHIVGRTDLLGSFLHNCISAEAFCDAFAGSLFEESSLQAARYAGACLDQLNKLCDMMGLLRPIIDAPPASTLLTRDEYETVHLNTQFPDKFLSKMRKRAHCRRNILERFAVVHIRRGDICRERPDPCRGFSRFVEVSYFRRHVDAIRKSGIGRIVVLTEAQNSEDVVQEFTDCEVCLARFPLDSERVVTDWELMATCDVLVLSPSSFSFVPALFNVNTVIYKPFWHAPLPGWIDGDVCTCGPRSPHVVITTDSSNELKRRVLDDIKSAGVNLTLLVDSKSDDESLRGQGCIFDHERMCERYGRRKVEVFNGRWRNNAAKLSIFEFIAQQDCDVWAFEDDVYCRDWKAFVGAYAEDRSDFIGSVFHGRKQFKEFYVNGWLCGHPDHLSHGVAGLYAFRASPRFARAVLDALKTVRHSSHHELFVPWVCRDFEHSQLLEGHARFMSHNPDPRMNSGMSVDALHESGLIFHPVKKKSKAVYRNSATPNGPKTKLWIIINSFNSSFYVDSAVKLSTEINRQLKTMVPQPRVLLVIGGSKKRQVDSLPMFCACRIQQNLSDYGSLVGVHDALESNVMQKSDRCVLLHDTVWPREDTFFRAMIDIQNTEMYNTPFCFAHPLGWYNLGVGSADFFARMGSQYQNVDILPKELGYKLEHGNTIFINGAKLSPLREHSIYTIAKHRVSDGNFGDLTTHSTGAMNIDGRSRVVVFLPSLGVFKFTHGPTSYQVPIYADTDLPRTEEEWRQLQRKYPQMNWCLPLIQIND